MNLFYYNRGTMRVIVAVFISVTIVLNGKWHKIGLALTSSAFYFAVFISFGIALLLLWYIHNSYQFLDRLLPWRRIVFDRYSQIRSSADWFRWLGTVTGRIIIDLLVCVVVPIIIDLVLVYIYLKQIGQDIRTTGFLQFDFPVIVLFLIVANIFNVIFSLRKKPTEEIPETELPQEAMISLLHEGSMVYINIKSELLYCCRKGRTVTIYTINGQSYHSYATLSNLICLYNHAGLIQINRSTLINLHTVDAYEDGQTKDTLQLYLKEAYENIPSCQSTSLFVVTKAYISPFLSEYKRIN